MRAPLLLSLLAAATTTFFIDPITAEPGGPTPLEAEAHITVEDARAHVEFLASDALRGRDTPSLGLRAASAYVATRFKRAGFQPGFEGAWFQPFELAFVDLDATSGIEVAGKKRPFDATTGVPFGFTAESKASRGEVVFCGYGITAADANYDDYAGIDVTGKVVLVLRYAPNRTQPNSFFSSRRGYRHQTFNAKVANAIRHGAKGLLLVTGLRDGDGDRFVSSFPAARGLAVAGSSGGQPDRRQNRRIPAIHISRALTAELLAQDGLELGALQDQINAREKPASRALTGEVSLTIALGPKNVETRNVVGFLPGSDPKLKDEVVVIGAHYDHVGVGGDGEDTIHNGADDNASGTAALIELADALGQLKGQLKRSVLLLAFAGEEKGLFGSKYYVARPIRPLEKTVAMLNMDMVGRNAARSVNITGAKKATRLEALLLEANKGIDYKLELPEQVPGNSDHAPFYQAGIPVLFFHTGLHADYHKVTDHSEKVDYIKIRDVARLCLRVTTRLCLDADKPRLLATDARPKAPAREPGRAAPRDRRARLY